MPKNPLIPYQFLKHGCYEGPSGGPGSVKRMYGSAYKLLLQERDEVAALRAELARTKAALTVTRAEEDELRQAHSKELGGRGIIPLRGLT